MDAIDAIVAASAFLGLFLLFWLAAKAPAINRRYRPPARVGRIQTMYMEGHWVFLVAFFVALLLLAFANRPF